MSDADTRPAAPAPPALFPAFLRLTGKRVLVVGAGPVAASKLKALIDAEADITVVAPVVHADIEAEAVTIHRRPFEVSDLDGVWYVVAAAPPEVNRAVSAAGRRAPPVRQRRRRSAERLGLPRRHRQARWGDAGDLDVGPRAGDGRPAPRRTRSPAAGRSARLAARRRRGARPLEGGGHPDGSAAPRTAPRPQRNLRRPRAPRGKRRAVGRNRTVRPWDDSGVVSHNWDDSGVVFHKARARFTRRGRTRRSRSC